MPTQPTSEARTARYHECYDVPTLSDPLRVAVIGAGARSTQVYLPLLPYLKPWVEVVAVCDPVREHADRWAAASGASAYHSIHDLVKARLIEAAIVVTPIDSHHSISVYLSSHGIHNHIETQWASMYRQAADMCAAAKQHHVITRVAENFFRSPYNRFAQTVARSGYLGKVERIMSYNDQTGYHNSSRWLAFAQTPPQWVQAIEHDMAHLAFYSQPERRHEVETFKARCFQFPNLAVMDIGCGHGKGLMGRQARPGHTEWHGSRGTLSLQAMGVGWAQDIRFELRRMSDAQLAPAQEARDECRSGGNADQISRVHVAGAVGDSARIWSDTPEGLIERVIPFCPAQAGDAKMPSIHTGLPVMDHIIDFALAVRGVRESEYTDTDALMSEMMEAAAHESALQEGRRIKLPLEGDQETDAITDQRLRTKYNVDPMDVEAMLNISYPKP